MTQIFSEVQTATASSKKAFFDRETGRLNRYSGAELGLPYKLFTEALTAPVGDHRTLILSRLMPLLHSISVVFDTRSDDDDSDSLEHRIVSFVGSRISDDISLDTICREFYISKPQLCRIFKAATGSGVWEYITVKRLALSRELMQSGVAPTKAAAECGFKDYSVFYRSYRKHYGTSPSEKRR